MKKKSFIVGLEGLVPIESVKPDPANVNDHPPDNLAAIKSSLTQFGQVTSIVTKRDGTIVKGNGTWLAMKELGHKEIKRVFIGDENEEKAEAYAIADNQSGRLSKWNDVKLAAMLESLKGKKIDPESLGFSPKYLADLLDRTRAGIAQDEGEIPEPPKAPKTKLGQIFKLGDHRLICGDATDTKDIKKLMGKEKADMCFTSPPYNLADNAKLRGYNGNGKNSLYIERSDHKSELEYLEFLKKFTVNALSVSDTVFVNIQCLAGNKFVIPEYWHSFSSHLIDVFCWDKEHAPPQLAERVLNSVWEFIFIFSNENRPKRTMKHGPLFRGNIDNIYRLNPTGKKDKLAKDHGACFPLGFAKYFIEKFSDKIVLDMFGGSGTTLIAAEQTGRACRMIELAPGYCDVIIERWERMTKRKAEKL